MSPKRVRLGIHSPSRSGDVSHTIVWDFGPEWATYTLKPYTHTFNHSAGYVTDNSLRISATCRLLIKGQTSPKDADGSNNVNSNARFCRRGPLHSVRAINAEQTAIPHSRLPPQHVPAADRRNTPRLEHLPATKTGNCTPSVGKHCSRAHRRHYWLPFPPDVSMVQENIQGQEGRER